MIQHENMRVAVIGMMNNPKLYGANPQIQEFINKEFFRHFEYYVSLCDELSSCDGKPIEDTLEYSEQKTFQYKQMKIHLQAIKSRLDCEAMEKTVEADVKEDTIDGLELQEKVKTIDKAEQQKETYVEAELQEEVTIEVIEDTTDRERVDETKIGKEPTLPSYCCLTACHYICVIIGLVIFILVIVLPVTGSQSGWF